MSEEHALLLLGRWLHLHYLWQTRLPRLAAILSLPAPSADSDPAIRAQHAEASAELHSYHDEVRHWGAALEAELLRLSLAYRDFAGRFTACHAAYEAVIARLADSLPAPSPGAIAPLLEDAGEQTRALNLDIRLRLASQHPVPDQKFASVLVTFGLVGGVVFGLVFFSLLPVLLGIGFAFLAAWLADTVGGHSRAVAKLRSLEHLIDGQPRVALDSCGGQKVAVSLERGHAVTAPGLPLDGKERLGYISPDCIMPSKP